MGVMKIVKIAAALKHLRKINQEIQYLPCFQSTHFSSGVIAFRPNKKTNGKQIEHADKDVVCQVVKGSGRLRIGNRRIALRRGMICHIPKKTPHDFAASKTSKLLLFFSLINS
jgi:mannose-6-phosphate isomerase-like protein (cupin superfamily)